jgi:phosphatidylserine/phosphatidylglycerophosphate/cardiolipin synthase-like enzyme
MSGAPLRRAHVQVVTGDVLARFAAEIVRTRRRLRRVTIVSPWISDKAGADLFERVLRRVVRDDATLVLVTRPSSSADHSSAISRVENLKRGRVFLNHRLHAKLYLCEQEGEQGFAIIGSANMSASSSGLQELAVIIRPLARDGIIYSIAQAAMICARCNLRRRNSPASWLWSDRRRS